MALSVANAFLVRRQFGIGVACDLAARSLSRAEASSNALVKSEMVFTADSGGDSSWTKDLCLGG